MRRMLSLLVLATLILAALPMIATASPPEIKEPDSPPVPNVDSDTGAPRCGVDAAWPGPDGFGYMGMEITFDWVDIAGTGTAVYLGDDDHDGPFPIGFSFGFYGDTFTDFYVQSNGTMNFADEYITLSNQCPLPADGYDTLIAMMWDDLDPGDTSDPVYYETLDPCPIGGGICLVVQYENFHHYPGGGAVAGTWETILFDNGEIIIQFEDAGDEEGSGSTTGIEDANAAGDWGLTYACDTGSSLTDGLALLFGFPEGLILDPELSEKAGCEGSAVEHVLTLSNYTGADGTFDLAYNSGWPISGPDQIYLGDGVSQDFIVEVEIPCGGVEDFATVDASGNGYDDQSTLHTFSTAGGYMEWESVAPINGAGRSRPAMAQVDGKLYLVGGEISGGRAEQVEEYDPATNTWTIKDGLMPIPASNVCAAAIGTDIFVPGGYDASGTYLNTLQVYHTSSDSWEVIDTDPLPVATSGPACAGIDPMLYLFGGSQSGTYTADAYVYDMNAPAGSRWTQLPSMTYARGWPAGAVVGDKVYAVGGRDGSTTNFDYVEAYDPDDGMWHTVTPMNTARGGPGAMGMGDDLVVCAGGWSNYYNSCERYDVTQGYGGAWTTMDQTMITGRRTYGYAATNDALYAVAGYNGTFLQAAERLPYFECPPCGDEIHVENIFGLWNGPILVMKVQAADQDGVPMADVRVDATVTTPSLEWARWRWTRPSGWARFWAPLSVLGTYGLCVDDLTLAGYVYNPDDNVFTCRWWDFPP